MRKLPAASRRQSCPVFAGQTSEPELPSHVEFNQWGPHGCRQADGGGERGYLQTQDPGCSELCSYLPTLPCGAWII